MVPEVRTPPTSPVGDGSEPAGDAPAPGPGPGPLAIAGALAGTRILVTGATGFLGTALVERLLRRVPDCEVVVLVRRTRRLSASERTQREIVRNDCFDRLRAEWGEGFAEQIGRRLSAVTGDVGRDGLGLDDAGREILASCDTVIHSAATVS